MKTPASSAPLLAAVLGASLAACGGDRAADAPEEGAGAAAGPVYTSEVENVSRWIREGGADADLAGLTATKNPRGEGVLVYGGVGDTAGGERATWVVVDSQVVPLNEASRRATPTLPARDDARTWERIGIRRDGGSAELRRVVPREPPPRADSAAEAPVPLPPAAGPPDTLHVPAAPRDTLRVPAPVGDTARPPLPDTLPASEPATPDVQPEVSPSAGPPG